MKKNKSNNGHNRGTVRHSIIASTSFKTSEKQTHQRNTVANKNNHANTVISNPRKQKLNKKSNSKSAIIMNSSMQQLSKDKEKTANTSMFNFMNNGSTLGNFINKHRKHKNNSNAVDSDEAITSEQKNALSKIDISRYDDETFKTNTIDLLGYKGLTHDNNQFLVRANEFNETVGFAEIIKVSGEGLSDLPDNLMQAVVAKFINFLRVYLDEINFTMLPLPNDTKRQQRQWEQVRRSIEEQLMEKNIDTRTRAQLVARRNSINEKIAVMKDVDLNLVNQGFAMWIFGKNKKELESKVNLAFKFGNDALTLSKMTKQEKETIIHRINNPTTLN